MFDHLAEGRFVLGVSAGALAGRRRAAWPPERGPHPHLPRGGRRDPGAMDHRRALQLRSPGQPLQDFQRQDGPSRVRPRHGRQSLTRNPIPKSSAPSWRRARAARRSSARRAFIRCRRIFCCRNGCSRIGTPMPRARVRSAIGQSRMTGASRARSSLPMTTRSPRATRSQDPNSPYRFYYFNLLRKFRVAKRLAGFKQSPEQPDAEITDRLRGGSAGHPWQRQQDRRSDAGAHVKKSVRSASWSMPAWTGSIRP